MSDDAVDAGTTESVATGSKKNKPKTAAAPAALVLGMGMDAAQVLAGFADGLAYPVSLNVENRMRGSLVLAQAQPLRVIDEGATVQHECPSVGQLYDLIFGMIGVGDRLQRDTIGAISVA
jgi:hypothetical protein